MFIRIITELSIIRSYRRTLIIHRLFLNNEFLKLYHKRWKWPSSTNRWIYEVLQITENKWQSGQMRSLQVSHTKCDELSIRFRTVNFLVSRKHSVCLCVYRSQTSIVRVCHFFRKYGSCQYAENAITLALWILFLSQTKTQFRSPLSVVYHSKWLEILTEVKSCARKFFIICEDVEIENHHSKYHWQIYIPTLSTHWC